jgi:hypothetical protein
MIGRPICSHKPPEAVTPKDIAASETLKPVARAVRNIPAVVHAAVSSTYARKYASYLQVISRFERTLIDKAEAVIPLKLAEKSFNIFDFARQVTAATLPVDIRRRCDELLANVIVEAVLGAPLRPCPGLSVATFLITPTPMPIASTRAWEIISTKDGQQAFRERLKDTFLASKWELGRWREEGERLSNIAEQTGLDTPFALAAWMDQAAEIRLMYAALCASIAGVGRLSPEQMNKVKVTLRTMTQQDPIGAEEFSVDPWMLLQQEVIHDSGEPRVE